nr:ribulose bisphosphate carboxylase/oxygenase activase 2, chloroplastic [Quercus suber]
MNHVKAVRKFVTHIVKNYIAHLLNIKIPLILGIWGGKGQGKSFQTELVFQAMGIEPIIMSAGELESERAGEPGRLIRERYRTASQVVQNQGKMSCLMINDIDAGLGRFGNTQMTVNNQIVVGTLMNLADNPTRGRWQLLPVLAGSWVLFMAAMGLIGWKLGNFDGGVVRQPNREDIVNIVHRMYEKDGIPKDDVVRIVDEFPNQALDFYGALRSRTYDRSISKGRWQLLPVLAGSWVLFMAAMGLIGWKLGNFDGGVVRQPNREDIVNIVHRMYEKDGIPKDDVVRIVDEFPNQALDFYGALRSRTYDRSISKWIDEIGGVQKLGDKLLRRKKNEKLPVFTPPKQTVEALLESGYSLLKEQQLIMETRLSKEYMKNMDD